MLGYCDGKEYALGKKHHSLEHLRTISHLRSRTKTIGAMSRVRNALSAATHAFFQGEGFLYLNTPIITSSDCEGAGEAFMVDHPEFFSKEPRSSSESPIAQTQPPPNYFFDKKAHLTVSGQLHAECYAMGLSKVYTFGPTFRAENSKSTRHLAEFWMIEPEIAFANLSDVADIAERYIKHAINHVRVQCSEDLEFFAKSQDRKVFDVSSFNIERPFARITYTEAISILSKQLNVSLQFGDELTTEHEKFLAEVVFQGPVIVMNYPKQCRPFYMRVNDDGVTVANMDILFPQVGELVGGSQREERLDVIKQRMDETKLKQEEYSWYIDLRKFGTAPHSGFGLGFERLVMLTTGLENIRDVIPFPRFSGSISY